MTEIELELILGTDIAKRHSNRNTKYMKSYDNEKPSKYITNLDANNLYGWAMSQYLTYSRFKLLNKKINKFCLNSIGKNNSDSYIFKVDLAYPDELHDLHSN